MIYTRAYVIMLMVLLCGVTNLAFATLVDTEYGQVLGQTIPVDNGREIRNVDTFYAIPYGADTSGERRFTKPVPPEPWTEVFEADTLGDACPQSATATIPVTHPGWDRFSENCLHLNIYTPSPRDAGPYAVMVWFYGGAYSSGANFQYPGHFYATRDVIVVTANYRVGAFGFAFTGNDAAPGNMGLWDQNLALQFVQRNIANFNGDPNRVTVFGESAGAASTGLHIVSPQSKDLFHGAILESGAEKNPWVINPPESHPENYIRQVAVKLSCENEDDYVMMDCMRNVTWQELRENSGIDCAPDYPLCLGMAPVVDGEGGFLPETPHAIRERGDVMSGPIITGYNHDDGAFLLPDIIPETILGCCNRTFYLYCLRHRILEMFEGVFSNSTLDQMARALDYNYSPWPSIYDRWQNRQAFIEILTDLTFGYAWDEQLKDHQAVAPTYGFIYNYRGRNTSNFLPEWIGVPHIAELPYVWGFPMLPLNPELRNDSLMFFDLLDWTEEDVEQSIFIQDLFANFAKTGNPTPVPVDNPLGGTTTWPRFTWDAMDILVISNTSIEAEREWRQKDFAFWTDYIPYMTQSSGTTRHKEQEKSILMAPNSGSFFGDFVQFVMEANEFKFFEDLELDDFDIWI